MKKFAFIVSLLGILSAFTIVTTWTNDDAHSQIGFAVTHLGIADIHGGFNDFDATIFMTREDFSDAVFTLTAKVASIDTRIEARDNHLKSADFFNAEKYPEITFHSTSIKATGENLHKLTGDLTMNGVTKQVVLDLRYRGSIDNPMSKVKTAGFQLTGIIDRRDFNIGPGFPPPMISNEVRIKADGEFTLNTNAEKI
jgi:polyisoprenoid-binding protein YceI